MVELLSPAGVFEKMKTAFDFGADAVYFAGKSFGLRAFAGNFSDEEIYKASQYAHSLGKKVYVTLNIIAHDCDFVNLKQYLHLLEDAKVDGVIVADIGIAVFVKENSNLELHISTQANILNSHSAKFFASLGAKRLVLARELSLDEIKNIRANLDKNVQLETFVHGAMCISYSGRCLLSNYIANRDSNKGACAQACRWCYTVTEQSRQGQHYEIQEDNRGTYIFNSKDLCLINHINTLIEAGIDSFKIEGRMKSQYYVANVTNAYRRAIDSYYNCEDKSKWILPYGLDEEVKKSSHRHYTTGFYFNESNKEKLDTSSPTQTYKFIAVVLEDAKDGFVIIEQRNRFVKGDNLQVLSATDNFNKEIIVDFMKDEKGEEIIDAKSVNQKIWLKTDLSLKQGDILRIKVWYFNLKKIVTLNHNFFY